MLYMCTYMYNNYVMHIVDVGHIHNNSISLLKGKNRTTPNLENNAIYVHCFKLAYQKG